MNPISNDSSEKSYLGIRLVNFFKFTWEKIVLKIFSQLGSCFRSNSQKGKLKIKEITVLSDHNKIENKQTDKKNESGEYVEKINILEQELHQLKNDEKSQNENLEAVERNNKVLREKIGIKNEKLEKINRKDKESESVYQTNREHQKSIYKDIGLIKVNIAQLKNENKIFENKNKLDCNKSKDSSSFDKDTNPSNQTIFSSTSKVELSQQTQLNFQTSSLQKSSVSDQKIVPPAVKTIELSRKTQPIIQSTTTQPTETNAKQILSNNHSIKSDSKLNIEDSVQEKKLHSDKSHNKDLLDEEELKFLFPQNIIVTDEKSKTTLSQQSPEKNQNIENKSEQSIGEIKKKFSQIDLSISMKNQQVKNQQILENFILSPTNVYEIKIHGMGGGDNRIEQLSKTINQYLKYKKIDKEIKIVNLERSRSESDKKQIEFNHECWDEADLIIITKTAANNKLTYLDTEANLKIMDFSQAYDKKTLFFHHIQDSYYKSDNHIIKLFKNARCSIEYSSGDYSDIIQEEMFLPKLQEEHIFFFQTKFNERYSPIKFSDDYEPDVMEYNEVFIIKLIGELLKKAHPFKN